MGRNSDPEAPAYVAPQPTSDLMPDSNVVKYKTEIGNKLANFDDWYNPIESEKRNAYISNLTNTVKDTYDPMFRQTREDTSRRLGGLNNSIYMDKLNDIEKARSSDINRNINDYLQNESVARQQEQNTLLDQLASINGMTQSAYSTGLSYATPQNNYNMQNYQTLVSQQIARQQAQAAQAKQNEATMQAAAQAYATSDIKTKKNIEFLENKNGINWYEFEYKTDEFPELPTGKQKGVIAQEIEKIIPDAVIEINGIKHVDYSKIV